ncbi:uncharacterized protein LOC135397795 [Ornithodoros turicata]|uniref:uncharacterized protein LOC135397795 n=1 Tax=Ornithodoros turicata TaxID=34597 RepID=UPI0031389386
MKRHAFECARDILVQRVVDFLHRRGKRIFKDRDPVVVMNEWCDHSPQVMNNFEQLTVLQVREEDKPMTNYTMILCMTATNYVIASLPSQDAPSSSCNSTSETAT